MRRVVITFLALIVVLSFICVGCGGAATGQSAADFFKNNMVNIHVNAPAGGTTDVAARVLAKYWPTVTGGPPMQVTNHSGGGGEEGFDYVHTAQPDGLNIGVTKLVTDVVAPHIVGKGGISFDGRTMTYIGGNGFTPGVFALGVDRPYKTVADLQAGKGLRMGATSAGSAYHIQTSFICDVLKLDAKVITGYEATELGVALKRGELDGYVQSSANILMDMKNGYLRPLFSMTMQQSAWTDAPPMPKAVQMNADQTKMMQTMEGLGNNFNGFFGPPNLPADRLDFFRRAFDKINAMPEFLTDMKPAYPFWDPPFTGEQVQDLVKRSLDAPGSDPAIQAIVAKYAGQMAK